MMFIILFWLSSENLEPVSAAKTGRRFAMPKITKKRKKIFSASLHFITVIKRMILFFWPSV